jgi:radical SAM protein with 4Fe4S-binding SPASM domain
MIFGSNNSDKTFDVHIPWIIEDKTEILLDIHDRHLLGSKKHFVRFDFYPIYAPSHLRRHHAFWDLPLKHVKRERTKLTLNGNELILEKKWRSVRLKPVWKGDLDFIGYSMLHISLWDLSEKSPSQLTVKSSQHVIKAEKRNFPLEQVFLPLTQRCNLQCPMCMRHVPEKWNATDVSPEILQYVLDASPFIHSMVLGGIGETLLYENLVEVVSEFKRRMTEDSQVGFNTNGTLMTEQTALRLIDAGVSWITFSVDGASKSVYERIRPGANFEMVIKNISHTVKCRNSSGRMKLLLQANYVMQEENVNEIPAFVELAASLGLDSVTFSHFRDFRKGEIRLFGEEVLRPLFKEATKVGKRHKLNILLPRIHPLTEPQCPFMQAAYLWLSGEVVPCCRMLEGASPRASKTFGNVHKHPLLDVWNSVGYKEFRHRVLTDYLPDECKGCNYATGLLC